MRSIVNKTKTPIIGITKSKLDHIIPDLEVNLPGFGIIHIETVVVCFNIKIQHCKETENLVFNILLLNLKPITTGVFYRLLNQVNFIDLMVKKISDFNRKDNKIHFHGDFNINLVKSGIYILNGKRSTTSQGSVHTFIN